MDIPVACPVCGAYSMTHDGEQAALLAVCDVLVVKALETMGKWIVRAERSRYRAKGTRPWHECHTLWQPTDDVVDKALRGAWDVVPAMLYVHGCCDVTPRQVTAVLDSYVHDLVITGTPHRVEELAYRFRARLGLPVWTPTDVARASAAAAVAVG